MVGVDDLKAAMEQRNGELKKELRHNHRVAKMANTWLASIQTHIAAVKKCFDVADEPLTEIEWDPDNGKPYVCIKANVRDRDRERMKAYHRYTRQVSDTTYLHLIVLDLDVVPVNLGETTG